MFSEIKEKRSTFLAIDNCSVLAAFSRQGNIKSFDVAIDNRFNIRTSKSIGVIS